MPAVLDHDPIGDQRIRFALEHRPRHALALSRDGRHEALRVVLGGVVEHCPRLAGLDDAAVVHDGEPVAVLGDEAQVVGDQDKRRPSALAHLGEQVHDLRLHGHVQGGRWLVGDQEERVVGDGHRDHCPLPHAA